MQVGQRVAVAPESGGIRRGGRPNGQPALARVPVGIPGVGAAVAVGVKVECNLAVAVGAQFVAGAYRNRRRGRVVIVVGQGAAHAGRRDGVGGGVGGGVGIGIHRAVAVHIVADDIQVGQVVDLNEAVVVAVVVNALGVKLFGGVVAAVVQRRVAPGLERPGVGAGGTSVEGGVQGAPVGVNARVAGGRQQLGGGLAPAMGDVGVRQSVADVLAAGLEIPVGIDYEGFVIPKRSTRISAAIAHQPADIHRAGRVDRAGGVAVISDAILVRPSESGDTVAAGAGYRSQRVAGADQAVIGADQSAGKGCAAHGAGYIGADDPGIILKGLEQGAAGGGTVQLAGQPANFLSAVDINVDQAEAFHLGAGRARAQIAEQAEAVASIDTPAVVDIEVGNGVAVALKDGVVRARKSD